MNMHPLFLTAAALVGLQAVSYSAAIAGIDFEDGAGGSNSLVDDLDPSDGITVTQTVSIGTGNSINCCDGGAQTGRSSFIGRLNVPSNIAQPSVGDAAPANGVSFSINIPAGVYFDLTKVSWQASQATGSDAGRWVAFKTSLDATLLTSDINNSRPTLDNIEVLFAGAPFTGLTNTTIDFQWYGSGGGTGDSDLDNILIEGTAVPEPSAVGLLFCLFGLGILTRRRR